MRQQQKTIFKVNTNVKKSFTERKEKKSQLVSLQKPRCLLG